MLITKGKYPKNIIQKLIDEFLSTHTKLDNGDSI